MSQLRKRCTYVIKGRALWYFRNRTQLLQQDLKNKERIAAQTEELEQLYDQKNRISPFIQANF